MTVETTHEHCEHDPADGAVISQDWKWATVAGNAIIGLGELAAGGLSTLSVTTDGLHNAGDAAAYYIQSENILNAEMAEDKRRRLRKLSHYVIAATSIGASVKAGVDMGMDSEHQQNAFSIYMASASLALNGLLWTRLRNGMKRRGDAQLSVHEKDLSKHFWAVDIPSAALAVAGASLQRYNVHIEQVMAIASGLFGAYAFRPTRSNLAHNCLDHGHAHTFSPAGRHRAPKVGALREWYRRLAYKPRHAKTKY